MPPTIIHRNLIPLFNFVRKTRPKDINQLIPFFGTDVRKSFFALVAAEQPSTAQLNILRQLRCDDATLQESTAVAYQLMTSDSAEDRNTGAAFFGRLAETNPDHARLYLQTALLYLASPPEDLPDLDIEIRGHTNIVSHILPILPDLEGDMKENARSFVQQALTIPDIFDQVVSAAFMIMSALPPDMIPVDPAQKVIDGYIAYTTDQITIADIKFKPLQYLSVSISLFLLHHQTFDSQGFFLTSLPLNFLQTPTLMVSGLITAPNNLAKLPQIALYLTDAFLEVYPTRDFLRYYIGHPIPHESELVSSATYNPPKRSVPVMKVSETHYPYYIATHYGNMMKHLDAKSAAPILGSLFKSMGNITMMHMLLLSICRTGCIEILPANIINYLLDHIATDSDDTRMQLTAQCISLACDDPEGLMNAIDKWRNPSKCFIYAALFGNIPNLPEVLVIRAMHELDDIAQNTTYTEFALHALSVLFSSYSVQLGAMRVVDLQLQIIYRLLDSNHAANPYTLYLISTAFVNLLPIISPEIESERSESVGIIKLIISAFSYCAVPYSRQIYFHTIRAVFAFARNLGKPIRYPTKRGASLALQLAAAGALADMLKVTDPPENYFQLLPSIFMLLQRTDDKRASDFCQAIARAFVTKFDNSSDNRRNLIEWTHVVKTVLATSSLPDTESVTIEAAQSVKLCCTQIAGLLMTAVAQSTPLLTECLDDLMSSVTRAVECKNEEMLTAAYSLLLSTVDLFKDVTTDEGNRLLELYDSQFNVAVRHGFTVNLQCSGLFLLQYLRFQKANLLERPKSTETVLDSYVTGLLTCKKRNTHYTAIAAAITVIARQSTIIAERLSSAFDQFWSLFDNTVRHAIEIWSTTPPDWMAISQFRASYEAFFPDITLGYVWLCSTLKKPLDITKFIAFSTHEIQTCTEKWRVDASYMSLVALIEFYGKEVPKESIDAASAAVFAQQQKLNISPFLEACARLVSEQGQLWEKLMEYVLEHWTPEVIGYLLRCGKPTPDAATQIFRLAITAGQKVADIATLLFDRCPDQLPAFYDILLGEKTEFSLFQRVLVRMTAVPDVAAISEYAWKNFSAGGLQFMAAVLSKQPKIGFAIVAADELKTITRLCRDESTTVASFIRFVTYVLQVGGTTELNATAAAFAVTEIALWGKDKLKGNDIIKAAIQLLRLVDESDIKTAFSNLSERDRQLVTSMVEKATKSHSSKLTAFAVSRRREQDEWQDLEISD